MLIFKQYPVKIALHLHWFISKEHGYNNSMMRITKRNDKWVVELEGYGYPKIRNNYSKFEDAVDYAASSLKGDYRRNPEDFPSELEIK
jgi:hypothetical protein